MKKLFIIVALLLSTVIAPGISSAQTQSVTFNMSVHEGNIKEVIKQTWHKSVEPLLVSTLRHQYLEPYFINSSIQIQVPEPEINVTRDSVSIFINNFFCDGTYSVPYWPNPDVNVHLDITISAKFGVNSNKQLFLSSVNVTTSDVDIDIDGSLTNIILWLLDIGSVKNIFENTLEGSVILPGLNNLILTNSVFTASYPGTTTAITASVGTITYAAPYLIIPVTATFTINPGGGGIPLAKTLADQGQLPEDFSLGQNYPNPFNPSTSIEFALPQSSNVTLKIYNSLGQEVVTLVNHEMTAGYHTVSWNGRDNSNSQVSSGLYIYRLQAGNAVFSRKMTFVK